MISQDSWIDRCFIPWYNILKVLKNMIFPFTPTLHLHLTCLVVILDKKNYNSMCNLKYVKNQNS